MSNLNPSTAPDFSVSVSLIVVITFLALQRQLVILSLYLYIRNFFLRSFQTVLSVKYKLKAMRSSFDLWDVARVHLT